MYRDSAATRHLDIPEEEGMNPQKRGEQESGQPADK